MSHWIVQRVSSIALLVLIPFTIFVDFRFYLLLAACIAVHVHHGFDSIFLDYVHNERTKHALSTLVTFALFASFLFIGVILI
jgi:succinate dehydrogenase hydrophobic anchor subunit